MLFSGERKVLLEVFTNAHCYSCVAAYELFRQYQSTNINASKTSYVFYHIAQPGVEDSIYYANKSESNIRSAYYGSINAAPLLFIDGIFNGSNTKTWQQHIDSNFPNISPLSITITGSMTGSTARVDATVTTLDNISDNDLRIHIVVTESVSSYVGKNGVTPQIFAMRKMLTGASGEPFSISNGETKVISKPFDLNPNWDREKMWVTVFLQSASKKTVLQSEMISTTFFSITSVHPGTQSPEVFDLKQNYPNPFNPSTTISFHIPTSGHVSLAIYDLLGNEAAFLVNKELSSGIYSIPFDASQLSSGIYFYKLQSGSNVSIKKMLLLR